MAKAKSKKLGKKEIMAELGVAVPVLIFVLFALGVLFSIYYLPYLLIPLILANIVLLIINKQKGIIVNIVLLLLSLLLFVFLIEYFAYLLGALFSLYHAARIVKNYRKG